MNKKNNGNERVTCARAAASYAAAASSIAFAFLEALTCDQASGTINCSQLPSVTIGYPLAPAFLEALTCDQASPMLSEDPAAHTTVNIG